MKTIYLVVILLFFKLSYGQVYEFNKLVKHEFSTINFPNQERTNFFNSKDYSYYMKIYTENDSLKSMIIDTKRCNLHYFKIDKKDSIYFLKTVSFKKDTTKLKYTYKFSDLKIKKRKKEMSLTVLDKNKSKIAKYKLDIKESNHNYFPFFKLTGAMETISLLTTKPPFNFTILKAKGTNAGGKYITYVLKSIEDINISVKTPQY